MFSCHILRCAIAASYNVTQENIQPGSVIRGLGFLSDRLSGWTDGVEGEYCIFMDIIADWLSAARVSGTLFSRSELASPWGLEYPAAPRIAFHIVSRGQAGLRLTGRGPITPVGQGDIVLIANGQGHELLSGPDAKVVNLLGHLAAHPLGPDRTIRLGGTGAQTVLLCGAYSLDISNAGPLLSILPPVVHLGAEDSQASTVQATVQLLNQEMAPGSTAGETVIARLVDLLLIYVLRAWSRTRTKVDTNWLAAIHDPQLGCALARVHAEPARDWTVEGMAGEAGLWRSAFAKRFTALVGEAPLAYLTRWRLTSAARLLADTALPVATIAARVGYTSEFAFNRAFSRIKGLPPGKWRAGGFGGTGLSMPVAVSTGLG
jgi:AraC-like DNA-binding protein